MKITRDDARRIAALSALEFGESELDRVAGEMSRILDYVDQLDAVDVSGIAEERNPEARPLRPDEVRAADLEGGVEANAPSMLHAHFVVPKVIGGE